MSLESLRFMLGGAIKRPTTNKTVVVRHTEEVVVDTNGAIPAPQDHLTGYYLNPTASVGHDVRFINFGNPTGKTQSATAGTRTQLHVASGGSPVKVFADAATQDALKTAKAYIFFKNPAMGVTTNTLPQAGDHIRIFWEEVIANDSGTETAIEVTISPDTYPGTYRVIGDTFMRSQATGADEPFQFIIGKAKVLSEVTITLEAEGDPSTFEMSLNVLRDTNADGENEMMKLVRYNINTGDSSGNGDDYGSVSTQSEG